jgi:tetraacyldisaccharide 4'-kinase
MSAERLAALWYRHSPLAYALAPASIAYHGLTALRRSLYRHGIFERTRLDAPVIVIGNITVGGTGKTPLTLWLAEGLAALGRRPGVVCKSYAASADAAAPVSPADDPRVRGDEAVLLATRLSCPVWSGPDRVDAARALLAAERDVDLILCDDGLQHYALERDCEIALIDAARAFGNGWLLPAGPLREPVARLRSVDAVVLNGEDPVAGLPPGTPVFRMALAGERLRQLINPAVRAVPSAFAGKRVAAVAGIGNPQRYFAHLRALGLAFEAHPFPDHFDYRAGDLALPGADIVVMTEKDAIKCVRFRDARMWVLPVDAEVSGDLLHRVLDRVDARRGPSPPADTSRIANRCRDANDG